MCREEREWERANRKWSPLWIQQCPLGPSVPWSPLWWWVQPGSLPKLLFYAPSLAPGEGGVSLCHMFWSQFGGHQRGSALGSYKVMESSVLFVSRLAQFALVWWHAAVEGCCKKCQGQNWNFACFCNKFTHKGQDCLQQLWPQSGCFKAHTPNIINPFLTDADLIYFTL